MRFLVLAAFVLVPGAARTGRAAAGRQLLLGLSCAERPRSSPPSPGLTVAAPRSSQAKCRPSKAGSDRAPSWVGSPRAFRTRRRKPSPSGTRQPSDSEAEMARPGLNRRQVLASLGAAAVAPLGAPARAQAAPRVVVIGGGFAGAIGRARHQRRRSPHRRQLGREQPHLYGLPLLKPGDRRPAGVAGPAIWLRQDQLPAASTSSSPRLQGSTPPHAASRLRAARASLTTG